MNSITDALQTFYGFPSRARSAHMHDCVIVCCSCVLYFNYPEADKMTNLACWLRTPPSLHPEWWLDLDSIPQKLGHDKSLALLEIAGQNVRNSVRDARDMLDEVQCICSLREVKCQLTSNHAQ